MCFGALCTFQKDFSWRVWFCQVHPHEHNTANEAIWLLWVRVQCLVRIENKSWTSGAKKIEKKRRHAFMCICKLLGTLGEFCFKAKSSKALILLFQCVDVGNQVKQ